MKQKGMAAWLCMVLWCGGLHASLHEDANTVLPPPLQDEISSIDLEFGMIQLKRGGFLSIGPKTVITDAEGFVHDSSWLEPGQTIRYEVRSGMVVKILLWRSEHEHNF